MSAKMTLEVDEVELFRDAAGLWRWRKVARAEGLPDMVVADGGQGYKTETGVKRAAKRENSGCTIVVIETGERVVSE